MANKHSTLTGLFTGIADAIRSKTGGTGAIVADQFPEAIAGISVGVDTSDATASAGEILSGETAYVNGAKVTGSMANNGAVSQAINAGGSYTIPAGYHNGSGKVTGNSLASQTSGNAAAGDIASGKTAWVNGSKVTGNAEIESITDPFSMKELTRTIDLTGFSYVGAYTSGYGYTIRDNKTYLIVPLTSSGAAKVYIYAPSGNPVIDIKDAVLLSRSAFGFDLTLSSGIVYQKN